MKDANIPKCEFFEVNNARSKIPDPKNVLAYTINNLYIPSNGV